MKRELNYQQVSRMARKEEKKKESNVENEVEKKQQEEAMKLLVMWRVQPQ